MAPVRICGLGGVYPYKSRFQPDRKLTSRAICVHMIRKVVFGSFRIGKTRFL